MNVFCLIQVRNEERALPGFLHHMRDHVDGIVALDDCSTDSTAGILKNEPRVVSILSEDAAGPPHANETRNRHRLIREAARLGAAWVICADADERFEDAFLGRVREEADAGDRSGRHLRFVRIVNLWNSRSLYRLDGLCGPRFTCRMFKVPAEIGRRPPKMHQPWFPPELDAAPRAFMNANLYHLGMMERRTREARFRKFKSIDPERRHQAIGYKHLVNEANLELRPVLPWRRYTDIAPPRLPGWADPAPSKSRPRKPVFDELFYLSRYPDVETAIAEGRFKSAWHHFRRIGKSERRLWRKQPSFVGLDIEAIVTEWRDRRSS